MLSYDQQKLTEQPKHLIISLSTITVKVAHVSYLMFQLIHFSAQGCKHHDHFVENLKGKIIFVIFNTTCKYLLSIDNILIPELLHYNIMKSL